MAVSFYLHGSKELCYFWFNNGTVVILKNLLFLEVNTEIFIKHDISWNLPLKMECGRVRAGGGMNRPARTLTAEAG